MKMMSTKVCAPSWADIVKGKAEVAPPTTQDFLLELQLDASAEELAAPNPILNATANEFDPCLRVVPLFPDLEVQRDQMMKRAAEVQRLLLSCYSDDDSSDDEAPQQPLPAAAQKGQQSSYKVGRFSVTPITAAKTVAPPGLAVRPPPGLEGLADTKLNPFAKAFRLDGTCLCVGECCCPSGFAPSVARVRGNVTSHAINLDCYSSEEESPQPARTKRAATLTKRKPLSEAQLLQRAAAMQSLLLECYSDDEESSDDELPSKVAPLQESTSEGETSDSDNESLSSL